MTPIEATLAEREAEYGKFADNSAVGQDIKQALRRSRAWSDHPPDVREALDVIATKISRILSTTRDKADSWHDIAGYATLVEQRIIKTAQE